MTSQNILIGFAITMVGLALIGNGVSDLIPDVIADEHRIETIIENGTKIDRYYDKNNKYIKRVETSSEGDTDVTRNYNSTDELTEVVRVNVSTDDSPGSFKTYRNVETKRYSGGSHRPYETIALKEEEDLYNLNISFLLNRSVTTKTYTKDKPRKKLEKVVEIVKMEYIDKSGVPIYQGKRVTTDANGNESVEILNPETQEFEPELGSKKSSSKLIDLYPEVEAELKAACQSIQRREAYGFVAGPINLDGDWNAATAEAVRPFYEYYQTTMQEKKDGANFMFGQVKGFYIGMGYTTILEVLKCNIAVIRNKYSIDRDTVKNAEMSACQLRKYLSTIISDKKAMDRPDWRKFLIEVDEFRPCQ